MERFVNKKKIVYVFDRGLQNLKTMMTSVGGLKLKTQAQEQIWTLKVQTQIKFKRRRTLSLVKTQTHAQIGPSLDIGANS